ncbi:hypothetical protein ACFWWA_30130 [Streptomyces goshikiensis]|uniref:hypothetical protein n=1 Tax=Streptomyces goshikiensis TaxID=1942 RepID=UPI0036517C8C
MLLPSVSARPDVLVDQSPVTAASIRCPAPRGRPAPGAGPPHRDGLAAVLGATRALPAALAEPLPPALAAGLPAPGRPARRGPGLHAPVRADGPHQRTARAADLLPG